MLIVMYNSACITIPKTVAQSAKVYIRLIKGPWILLFNWHPWFPLFPLFPPAKIDATWCNHMHQSNQWISLQHVEGCTIHHQPPMIAITIHGTTESRTHNPPEKAAIAWIITCSMATLKLLGVPWSFFVQAGWDINLLLQQVGILLKVINPS